MKSLYITTNSFPDSPPHRSHLEWWWRHQIVDLQRSPCGPHRLSWQQHFPSDRDERERTGAASCHHIEQCTFQTIHLRGRERGKCKELHGGLPPFPRCEAQTRSYPQDVGRIWSRCRFTCEWILQIPIFNFDLFIHRYPLITASFRIYMENKGDLKLNYLLLETVSFFKKQ